MPHLAHHPGHSRCYTRLPDFGYDAQDLGADQARQPLGESTGNAQSPGLPGLAMCNGAPLALAIPPSSPTIFAPPSLGVPLQSRAFGDPRSLYRRFDPSRNPLYHWSKQFQDYRAKKLQKEHDKTEKWPEPLEDAFLDALLLMPVMGRRKFWMKSKPKGRNQLLDEYMKLFIQSISGNADERKKVSSHIQVVKNFFKNIRCFHFIFPREQDTRRKKATKETYGDDDEVESFKKNPILTALAEGRLPCVRPNYLYFWKLLALDELVAAKPKTCWVFVSSSQVRRDKNGATWGPNRAAIDAAQYPHLDRNDKRDGLMSQGLLNGTLLHEYSRDIQQADSASVKETTRTWNQRFPAMAAALDLPARDEDCVIYEMDVKLDLSTVSHFPPGSDLHGFVEMTIVKPGMEHHRWQCRTRLSRPPELCGPDPETDPPLLEQQTAEIGVQFSHREGCSDDKPDCTCMHQRLKDLRLPFLAAQWATILSSCANYPETANRGRTRNRAKKESDDDELVRGGGGRGSEKGDGDSNEEEEGEGAGGAGGAGAELTAGHLLRQVAMVQEVWSTPNVPVENRMWTRQAIVVWKFDSVHQTTSNKHVVVPAKTEWRYLTVNDPTSRYHQSQMYLPKSPTTASETTTSETPGIPGLQQRQRHHLPRDSIMSPLPHYSHHLAAAMSDNLNTAWDTPAQHHPHHPHHPHYSHHPSHHTHQQSPSPYHHLPPHQTLTSQSPLAFDSFHHHHHHGLETPPPSASLHGSYTSSFDTTIAELSAIGPNHPHHHLGFLSAAPGNPLNHQAAMVAGFGLTSARTESAAGHDPFLPSTEPRAVVYGDVECDPSLQCWDVGVNMHGRSLGDAVRDGGMTGRDSIHGMPDVSIDERALWTPGREGWHDWDVQPQMERPDDMRTAVAESLHVDHDERTSPLPVSSAETLETLEAVEAVETVKTERDMEDGLAFSAAQQPASLSLRDDGSPRKLSLKRKRHLSGDLDVDDEANRRWLPRAMVRD